MTARGDVLAMMDALLAFASRGVESDDPARPMIERGHEARAAVAELIEAGHRAEVSFNTVRYCYERAPGNFSVAMSELDHDVAQFRAALARIGGEA